MCKMENEITKNLVFLADKLTNLERILLHLEENGIISTNERHEILLNGTSFERNTKFLDMIKRKDWNTNKSFILKIMRQTNNEHCADKIEGIACQPKADFIHQKILERKWWPNKKVSIKSLYKRKIGEKFLVEDLHEKITKDENRMVVICESGDAAKLSGLGGVGKTLTATWYADEYEDQYTHVLWIDCGEGSLLTSFTKLARDLDVKHLNKLLDLDDYARKCHETLEQCKCLWIYDNAENYQGSEGINKILPMRNQNFSCLITSRNNEWGTENGFGEIPRFELSIFAENESLEFLKANLKMEYTEDELRKLCSTLGNLPLALQLAVAALKSGKIDIQNYTEKNQFKNIIDTNFDDYERTINGNIQISLDLLLREDIGKQAKEIFLIFGYIRPDEIKRDFFEQILKLYGEDMEEAIDLLAKYSLITKNEVTIYPSIKRSISDWSDSHIEDFSDIEDREVCSHDDSSESEIYLCYYAQSKKGKPSRPTGKMVYLSIHRLLQQLVRHNGKMIEKETLRKILAVGGDEFLDYQLVPFLQHADEDIRNEFPLVKAKLINQKQLVKLLKENRIVESVMLAQFIDREIKTVTTKFNYALCLEKNGDLEEVNAVLEDLQKEKMNEDKIYCSKCIKMGLLKLDAQVTKTLVEGHLLVTHWKMGNKRKMQEILEKRKRFTIIESQVSLEALLIILNSNVINSNYSFLCDKYSTIRLELNAETKKISLDIRSINTAIPMPEELEELSLTGELKIGQWNLDLREWIPKSLKRLTINCPLRNYGRDKFACIPDAERLKSEKERLKSFGKWPHTFIQPEDLAKAGFYFFQDDDEVECAFCGGTLHTWEENDDPMEAHRRLLSKCPFVSNIPVGNIPIEQEINARGVIISLNSLISMEYIDLSYCSLHMESGNEISPKELRLEDVSFIRNEHEVSEMCINEFVNFHQIERMKLICRSQNMNIAIDMNTEFVKFQSLHLHGVKILNSEDCRWNVHKLKLQHYQFVEKTKMEIEEMEIQNFHLDLSYLPPTIEKLSCSEVEIAASGEIDLPILKYLELTSMLPYLTNLQSVPLTHIHFTFMKENVNVDLLPESVSCIKISRQARLTGGVRQLEKLILDSLFSRDEEQVLEHLQTKQIVLYKRFHPYEPIKVVEYIQMGIKSIAVRVHWGRESFKNSILSEHVDRKSKYYFLEMGKGTSIEKKEFRKLMELV